MNEGNECLFPFFSYLRSRGTNTSRVIVSQIFFTFHQLFEKTEEIFGNLRKYFLKNRLRNRA